MSRTFFGQSGGDLPDDLKGSRKMSANNQFGAASLTILYKHKVISFQGKKGEPWGAAFNLNRILSILTGRVAELPYVQVRLGAIKRKALQWKKPSSRIILKR